MRIIYQMLIAVFILSACQDSTMDHQEKVNLYQNLSLEARRQPQNALLAMNTHPELEVELFAAEPMLTNPTNIDVDAKGRVWVCEAYNYGLTEKQQTESGGKITILEDTNGDGKADKSTLFYQGEDVSLALGIAVLGNKVFVTQSPNLLVFTDEDGDDQPDKKEVLFTGMGGPGDHSAHALIFGPDGKFYFNYGNAGQKVLDPDQNPVIDQSGHQVVSNGKPYHGGMIFRCNPDGSDFEVLAHNFRNNYEVTVDSYGNVWQSDNDDDGNKSCRINFILERGNYGYRDEITGAHWSVHRTGQHAEIPGRHWHQNDPGVVPNLLITGAGSPAGICYYEGELLPKVFQNQMIHTDAGPNVVRAYPVEKNGAGYQAKIENILWTDLDKWFRPVDVATAPDGSLMVADWYDPIVGGGAVGDTVARGRIYRIAPKVNRYKVEDPEVSNLKQAIRQLKSPNMSARYLGWSYLSEAGPEAEPELMKLWKDQNPVFRVRALWLLGKLPAGQRILESALEDENEDIRVAAIRVAAQQKILDPGMAEKIIDDPSPQVRRTLALKLDHLHSNKAVFWTQLASQYDGDDEWYLEALGIAAENGNWDTYFSTWLTAYPPELRQKSARDIIWRSRAKEAVDLKARLIANAPIDEDEMLRMFRAFDFHPQPEKNQVLLSLLEQDHENQSLIDRMVIQHIDPEATNMTAALKQAIDQTLVYTRGTQDYINIIDQYQLTDHTNELLELALKDSSQELAVNAMKVLLGNEKLNGVNLIKEKIQNGSPEEIEEMLTVLAPISTEKSLSLISETIENPKVALGAKRTAIQALGRTWWGEEYLLEMVKEGAIESSLENVASSVLFSVYRANIRQEAANYLDQPGLAGGNSIPPVRDLLSYAGNAARGQLVYDKFCSTCHRARGKGINFGPDLTEIGDKLSREGLFQAIIYPNQGINNGYEGYIIKLTNGGVRNGIILSESEEAVIVRQIGGTDHTIPKAEIEKMEMMETSLMTSLAGAMSQEELVDLVEYLTILRKEAIQ